MAEGLPTFEIARDTLIGMPLTALAHQTGLTSSASEARRFIQGNGLKLNDAAVTDVKAVVSASDITAQGALKLSIGKKKHVLVKPV